MTSERFDLIVTNPPYFNKSLAPPDKKRHHVRHTTVLAFEDLLSVVARLLSPEGKFNVILPYQEGQLFSEAALRYQLHCSRRYFFRSRREKPIERTLMEFTRNMGSLDDGEILLYEAGLEWSSSYTELTTDFYLKK
jgi:tRNA1Val (adenine37-N6)-methyltransferase